MLIVSAGVPQGAIWLPLLFNLYIRFLPSVVRSSSVIGYANDHTLLKIIHLKQNFAPLKTKTLLISLKQETLDHPALLMNNYPNPGVHV